MTLGKVKITAIILDIQNKESLQQCLDSIVAQTLTDFEIIIVDDGNYPEDIKEVIEKFFVSDNRLRIIIPKNTEICFLRKEGLDAAGGDYAIFIDSLDILTPDAFEKMYENITANKADIAVTDIEYHEYETNKPVEVSYVDQKIGFDPETNFSNYTFTYKNIKPLLMDRFICVWNKIYNMDFLRTAVNFCFAKDEFYDSIPFQLQMLLRAKQISFSPHKLYKYRLPDPSSAENEELPSNTEVNTYMEKLISFRNTEKDIEDYIVRFLEYIYNDFAFSTLDEKEEAYSNLFLNRVKKEFMQIIKTEEIDKQEPYRFTLYKYLISSATNHDSGLTDKIENQAEIIEKINTSYDIQNVLLNEKEEHIKQLVESLALLKEENADLLRSCERQKSVIARKRKIIRKLKSGIGYKIFSTLGNICMFPVNLLRTITGTKKRKRDRFL